MNYYETIYSLKEKDHYLTAQVIKGQYAGLHAVFSKDGFVYAEGDSKTLDSGASFWEKVREECRNFSSFNITLSIGENLVYVEKLSEELRLVICGAGHVSVPVIRLAKTLGFYVIAIDDRNEFAENAREAGADEVFCGDYREILETIEGSKNTYFAIITRGHRHDRSCLEEILSKENAYIGMIGSKGRVAKQFSEMKEAGFPADRLSEVHSPIGLNIGAQTPDEIAVAVMAEIIQVKNSRIKTSGYDKKMLLAAAGRHPDHPCAEKAVVTIIHKSGSGPREAGTKMLVFSDGTIIGTIGGGCLELEVQQKAVQCIREKKNEYFHYDMSLKAAEEDGMACGGSADLYIDVIRNDGIIQS